jgi:hypothetical protein
MLGSQLRPGVQPDSYSIRLGNRETEEFMSRNLDNRKRAFADVVSIDVWHDAFDRKHPKVDLHADVAFSTARVGGEPESPIRFRLSLRRAEVVVVIPDTEPASVDRKSVARDSPKIRGHRTETFEKKATTSAKGRVSGSASNIGIAASASAEASAQADQSGTQRLEVSAPVQLMNVIQSQTGNGDYRWLVTPGMPGIGEILEGRPWDAATQPRLKIVDQRKDRSTGLPPVVRLQVECRREDLVIEDLHIKDESVWENVKSRLGFKNRLAAAESYIRDRLREEGLEVKNIEDAFGRLILGSVTAQST